MSDLSKLKIDEDDVKSLMGTLSTEPIEAPFLISAIVQSGRKPTEFFKSLKNLRSVTEKQFDKYTDDEYEWIGGLLKVGSRAALIKMMVGQDENLRINVNQDLVNVLEVLTKNKITINVAVSSNLPVIKQNQSVVSQAFAETLSLKSTMEILKRKNLDLEYGDMILYLTGFGQFIDQLKSPMDTPKVTVEDKIEDKYNTAESSKVKKESAFNQFQKTVSSIYSEAGVEPPPKIVAEQIKKDVPPKKNKKPLPANFVPVIVPFYNGATTFSRHFKSTFPHYNVRIFDVAGENSVSQELLDYYKAVSNAGMFDYEFIINIIRKQLENILLNNINKLTDRKVFFLLPSSRLLELQNYYWVRSEIPFIVREDQLEISFADFLDGSTDLSKELDYDKRREVHKIYKICWSEENRNRKMDTYEDLGGALMDLFLGNNRYSDQVLKDSKLYRNDSVDDIIHNLHIVSTPSHDSDAFVVPQLSTSTNMIDSCVRRFKVECVSYGDCLVSDDDKREYARLVNRASQVIRTTMNMMLHINERSLVNGPEQSEFKRAIAQLNQDVEIIEESYFRRWVGKYYKFQRRFGYMS